MRASLVALLFTLLPAPHRTQKNMYFDKSLPDEETNLTDYDFAMVRVYRDSYGSRWRTDDSAMYRRGRFEGDIVNPGLTSKTVRGFVGEANPREVQGVMRNAVRQTYLKWTDARIPYTISAQYSSFSRSKIAEAIEEYRKLTCIDFAPKSAADPDYIHIVPDDGCYSLVGRIGKLEPSRRRSSGGKQPVSLGDGCIQKGIIIHELMHAVGFFHEQSRADRDDHVSINWENVEAGLQDQFDKYSLNMIDHLGTAYDYGSVMHYSPTAFSKNGKPTIEPKKRGVEIGQRNGFSSNDLYKINKLYKCPQLVVTTASPEEEAAEYTKQATMKPTATSALKPAGGLPPITGSSRPTGGTLTTSSSGSSGSGSSGRGSSGHGSIGGGSSSGSGSSGSGSSGGGDTDPPSASCRDKRRDCEFLANSGHCESRLSSRFMSENCAKSCGKCNKVCEDSRTWCERWANSGMCTQAIFQEYMQSKCAKSCQLC